MLVIEEYPGFDNLRRDPRFKKVAEKENDTSEEEGT